MLRPPTSKVRAQNVMFRGTGHKVSGAGGEIYAFPLAIIRSGSSPVTPGGKLPRLPVGVFASEQIDLLSSPHLACLDSAPAPTPAGIFLGHRGPPPCPRPLGGALVPLPARTCRHSSPFIGATGVSGTRCWLSSPSPGTQEATGRGLSRRPLQGSPSFPDGEPRLPQPAGALWTSLPLVPGSTRRPSSCRPAQPPRPLGREGPGTPPRCRRLSWRAAPLPPKMLGVLETDPGRAGKPGAEGAVAGEDGAAPHSEEPPVSAGNASPLAQLFLFRGLSSSSSSFSSIFPPSVQLFVFSDRARNERSLFQRHRASNGPVPEPAPSWSRAFFYLQVIL